MPTLDEVYRKFGEVAEAAQLLETQLGNLLFKNGIVEADLISEPNHELASEIIKKINRQTLGQLINNVRNSTETVDQVELILTKALDERNRLSHSFYRLHNFRRNTEEGRAVMLKDLDSIHKNILIAYKTATLLSGIDIDKIVLENLPKEHLHI